MQPDRRLPLVLAVVAVALLPPGTAGAQSAGAEEEVEVQEVPEVQDPATRIYADRLLVNFTAGGGYDGNVLARGGSSLGSSPFVQRPSSYADVSGALTYLLTRSAVAVGVSADSTVRHYPKAVSDYIVTHRSLFDADVRVGRRTHLRGIASGNWQPYYPLASLGTLSAWSGDGLPGASPGDGGTPSGVVSAPGAPPSASSGTVPDSALDSTALHRRGVILAGKAELSTVLGRDTRLVGACEYQSVDFAGRLLDQQSLAARARLTSRFTRNTALRLGYGYEEGRYGSAGGRPVQIHLLDTGLDYSRALSDSRRTTLDVTTGAALLRDRNDRFLRLTGRFRLARRLGRTWNADVAYQREAGFIQAFPGPTTWDAVTANLHGFLGQGLEFQAAASYSSGFVGLSRQRNRGFDVYSARVSATATLTRHLTLSVEPFYYYYSFASSDVLPAGWSREVSRPGILVQLATWFPVFQRARRPDADR